MTLTADKLTILRRIACGGVRQREQELRYQLKRDGHPLAESSELVLELARLERDGLVLVDLELTLTPAGREAISGE